MGTLWAAVLLATACGNEHEEAIPTPPITTAPTSSGPVAPSTIAAEPAPTGEPPEVARPYDEGANATAEIRAAVARANARNKRVILVFGGNWCVWCRRLEWVFQNHAEIRAKLDAHFEVVHVDTGSPGSRTNRAVIARYGNPVQHGLPVLVVLDGSGTQVATQETGALEDGNHHDPARVLAFLDRVKG